jgi:hypothetical protein
MPSWDAVKLIGCCNNEKIDGEWTLSTDAVGSHGCNRLQTPNWMKWLKKEAIV